MSYSVPANEAERLAAVRALNIIGTPPEVAFDEISVLAAQICQCPVSYITFADDDRFWLKAKYGLAPDFNECPREISFCATTICGEPTICKRRRTGTTWTLKATEPAWGKPGALATSLKPVVAVLAVKVMVAAPPVSFLRAL